MKRLLIATFFILPLFPTQLFACEQWVQIASFPAAARHRATAFVVGNKGYVGGGHINSLFEVIHEDFWEYDPGSNTWTQIANFPGGKRYHSVAFTIGDYGYVGCGEGENNDYFNDFYRYVPGLNIWQPIANFPGTPRRAATSFVINNKGYVGTGQSDFGYENNFYRYVPGTDSWEVVANFLGEARSSAVGFSHNGKGYVGTGHIFGDDTKDFYEYDPDLNQWTQKADVGAIYRQDATGFVLNGFGYIATGNDVEGDNDYKDVWRYDFNTDTWTQIEDFCGAPRRYMVSFVLGNVAYAGGGTDGTNLNDFYMFNPLLSVDETEAVTIKIFPNPSSDLIELNFSKDHNDIKVYSLSGKLMFSGSDISDKVVFNKKDFGAGTFIYQITQNDESVHIGKFSFI
ncbi:T9SS type A sorting domain-containing protein [Paracrocinitomix mangrovi]|uniref:Kelch repeat-containing protein n=1 Tax=Paracrocinitomix mangrovi TaxID=2862509 RepID=UPI001C8D3987|nr:kelch repeat-containing protein [Paracrocinitomix mangrovi]UKN03572.1 T9SS type A sorting domain-containing protein [Paracrocinitomix mangrovi]